MSFSVLFLLAIYLLKYMFFLLLLLAVAPQYKVDHAALYIGGWSEQSKVSANLGVSPRVPVFHRLSESLQKRKRVAWTTKGKGIAVNLDRQCLVSFQVSSPSFPIEQK